MQAALTFLPAAKGKDVRPRWSPATPANGMAGFSCHHSMAGLHQNMSVVYADELETWELAKLLLFVGSCAGIAGGLLSAGLPLVIPHALSQDVALHPIMRSVLPQVSVASDLAVVVFAMCAVPLSSNHALRLAPSDFVQCMTRWCLLHRLQVFLAMLLCGWEVRYACCCDLPRSRALRRHHAMYMHRTRQGCPAPAVLVGCWLRRGTSSSLSAP